MAKKKNQPNKTRATKGSPQSGLPLLALRDIVPIPGLVFPVQMAAGGGAETIANAEKQGGHIVLSLHTGLPDDKPNASNIAKIGGLAKIVNTVKMSNGDLKVRLHVEHRVKIQSFVSVDPFVIVKVTSIKNPQSLTLTKVQEKELALIKESLVALQDLEPQIGEYLETAREIFDPGILSDLIASCLPLHSVEAQRVLEELNPMTRLGLVKTYLDSRLDLLTIKERISNRAENELGKAQHEELLREQLRQIQVELGEGTEDEDELTEMRSQLAKSKMPAAVRKEAEKQVRRLQQLHPDTSEAALARTYLDTMLNLPWSKRTKDSFDLAEAKKILDEDHFGLEETKERILDFLGVRKLRKEHRGPVLLLLGPPGVGKTSLGRSIARALGRKFVKISVGGLRDEAELRGHRRTYVGAMPGRIIQGLHTAGVKNPVFMIDELDKIGSDFRGDPASVLLEVLDPEQNGNFEDHYLNVPFDLSEVMFICTANVADPIPDPLLDRMETIAIAGYTTEEKRAIARKYIIPREQKENGLEGYDINFEETALLKVIENFTRESGVRELTRAISAVFRKIARTVAEGQSVPDSITPELAEKFLGTIKYTVDERLTRDQVGVVTGLAWTSVGGEILLIEAAITKGKGSMSLTGQMGDVMRESAMAALTYVMSKAEALGIDPNFYENVNVHVHVPKGAIPKDGPSAGVAIATALVSMLTGKAISRNVAMTGEITLRGNVIQIGGLKEKALAALRAGIQVVVIPKENERELADFPTYLKDKVTFVPVESIDEVFKVAFVASSDKSTKRNPNLKSDRPQFGKI